MGYKPRYGIFLDPLCQKILGNDFSKVIGEKAYVAMENN